MAMTLTGNEKKFLGAADTGDLEKIKELITTEKISLKRHEEIRDGTGWTALMFASWKGHLNIVRFLVGEYSVYVDGKDNDGWQALHLASAYGHMDVIECLIVNGAKVNQQTLLGWTPLHEAGYWGKLSAVNLLLERGADPYIQNNGNETALDQARKQGRTDVANAIEQHIQRHQQIEKLLRGNDRLPIAIWPNALGRLNSINFIHQLVCELPQLFKQAPEKAQQESHSTKR